MPGQPPRSPARIELEADFERRWPGSNRLASACAVNLFLLNSLLDVNARRWAQREGYASSASFNVLTVLHGAAEPLLPSQIAERMLVSRATISGILDSLERDGRIVRLAHAGDGRMRLVQITPAARRQVERSMARLHLLERRIMSELPARDQAAFLRYVGSLQETVSRIGGER